MRTNRFVMGVILGVSLAVAGGRVEAKDKAFHAPFAGTSTNKDDFSFPGTSGAGYTTVAGKSTLGEYTAQMVEDFEPNGHTCTLPGGGSGVELVAIGEVWVLSFTATGDQLFLTLSPGVQVGCLPTTNGVVASGQITFDVIGGTGRFAGATGTIVKSWTFIGLAPPDSPSSRGGFASFTGTFDGTIELAK